jgi:hypothetical protein
LDQGIVRAFIAYYRRALFKPVINSELQVPDFLKTVTLKNMAYNIGLARRTTSSMTIKNCWSKYITTTGDGIEHEEEYLGFTEEDALKVSSTLYGRLQANNL